MGEHVFDENELPDSLMAQVEWFHTRLLSPSFNLTKMAAETDIAIAALYGFRSGRVKSPSIETFEKIKAYMMPRVVISGVTTCAGQVF